MQQEAHVQDGGEGRVDAVSAQVSEQARLASDRCRRRSGWSEKTTTREEDGG